MDKMRERDRWTWAELAKGIKGRNGKSCRLRCGKTEDVHKLIYDFYVPSSEGVPP